jgi:hypothetical protein
VKLTQLCLLVPILPVLGQTVVTLPSIPPPTPPPIIRRDKLAKKAAPDFQAETTLYSIGQPTDEEQLYLELINRARANPEAEGMWLATTTDPDVVNSISSYQVNLNLMKSEFAALPVRPPLAMNMLLTNAARPHTQYQYEEAIQSHTGSGGSTLGTRATAAGYDYLSLGENVFSYSKNTFYGHVGFQIDWGTDVPDDGDGMQAGRGHRVNIHGNFREVGIGIVLGTKTLNANTVGPQLVTQDFGTSQADDTLVTGVAYYDSNGNNFYDPGEGIGGLTVNVNGSSFHAVTANSGGYAVPVPAANATRTVTFSGLNANADQSAVISGAANVKVDFKPVYLPPALSGPVNPVVSSPADYTFNSVIGATGYEGRYAANVNATTDAAEDLSRVTVVKTGNYEPQSSTVKDSGIKAYHLAAPGAGLQTITYNAPFFVKDAASSLSFRSRLGIANTTQIARVQISTDGGITWSDVLSQAGTGQPGETTFQTRTVSLKDFAGKDIRLRFNYTFSGSFYNQTDDGFGWYIDNVAFTNMVDLSAATITTLPAGNTFAFTPPALGDFILSVGPLISGRNFGFGTPRLVTAVSSPPTMAEIEVEQSGGTPLIDGTSSVGFATQFLSTPQTLTFTIRNAGIEDLTGLSVGMVGTHAADFVAGSPGVAVLAQNASTTFDVTFTPSAKGVRTATLRVFSNDSNENPFDINLNGTGKNAPDIDVQPQPLVRALGTAAIFTVHATHPQPAQIHYQWRKNGVAILGATTDTLNLSSVKTTDATGYSVLVSVGADTTLSNIVQLAVVTPVTQSLVLKEKSAAAFTVTVAGSGYNLVWKKSTGSPPVIETLLGKTAKALALTNLNPLTDTATYTCEAQMSGSTAVAGTFNLRVFNAKPQITLMQAMPDGRISSSYTHQIKFDSNPLLSPTTFSAAPLPVGLKLDTKTGLITGKPTISKSYTLTLTATNSLGSTSTTDTILIDTLPAGVDGVYTGTVERDADLNLGLGGRIDLTITTTGTFTGTLALGTIKYAFTGAMDISVDAPPAPPEATVIIKRAGTLLPLTLKFTLDTAGNRFATASVTAGSHTAIIEAWRLVWKATGIPLNLATPLPKLFTFALKPPALPATMPRGDGYGSFTLGKDGKLSITGKVADGETYTCSSFAGPLGEIPLFQTLYVPNGSLLGKLDIDLADTGNLNSNILGGTVSWMRPANPLKTALVYKSGFGPATLTAVGALFTPPGAALILGLVTPDVDKARFVFADGGLGSSATSPNVLFDIGAGNKIKIPTTIAANPALVKLTSISLTTGLFSGSFTLQDNDPRAAFFGKKVTRTATFNGILTNDGTHPIGAGHFLLSELPGDAMPPIPATTPTTSKKLSGSVLMEKN